MRIGIDVRYLSHGLVGGVHTYVKNFVPPLVNAASAHQVFLYADSKRPFELSDLPSNVTVRTLKWRNALSSVYQDFTLRGAMARDNLDIAHFPANYGFGPAGTRTIITLHDAINILPLYEIIRGHPKKARTIAMMCYLHVCSTAALQRADLVLTDSTHAAQAIAQHGRLRPEQVVPIPLAPTDDLRRLTDQSRLSDVRRRYDLPTSYVLADALKNPAALIRAWREVPEETRQDRRIVFFSRRPDPLSIVAEAVAAREAQLFVRIPREDLIALYSMADAFVFPSWIEGFGIPILEAMTCGAPVIASDRGSIPEVVGEAGLLIDAEDSTSLASHIIRVLTDPALAHSLRQRGFQRAREYSWHRTAARILENYERVAARS